MVWICTLHSHTDFNRLNGDTSEENYTSPSKYLSKYLSCCLTFQHYHCHALGILKIHLLYLILYLLFPRFDVNIWISLQLMSLQRARKHSENTNCNSLPSHTHTQVYGMWFFFPMAVLKRSLRWKKNLFKVFLTFYKIFKLYIIHIH